ncbi:hypothetical protein D8674_012097 [Pyrus ussuriensis x Pyrus communis]|uniref:Uncharacterized protein n=1 Tax=Pyrus ussuriensis x Pyrus communis TaxID=2448454 RepID=A0A5N5G0J6_9ROSA|nr:hypothetical protein D8674_012097 [Pyrus ussuriensis x Pyrus communis]
MWDTIDVPIMHEYMMSNLISNHRAASRVSQTPSPAVNAATTSPPNMGTTDVPPVTPFGPTVSTALASSTSSMMHLVLSTRRTHRRPQSSEEAKQSGEASFVHGEGSQTGNASFSYFRICYSFRGGSAEFSVENRILLQHHYELTNLDANQNQYINDLCTSRFTQWKSDIHKHYEIYDGPEANSINRSKKKLFHRSGSRRFSYSTFLRRAMSDVTSFARHPLRRPMFPTTVFAFVQQMSLRRLSSYA